ncbi:MAG: hypothetical protein ABF283_09330 [Planktotalea arctica]
MTDLIRLHADSRRTRPQVTSKVDIEAAWKCLGQSDDIHPYFKRQIFHIIEHMSLSGDKIEKTPSAVRKRKFANIISLSERLSSALEQIPHDMDFELTDYFMCNFSPDEFIGTENEGLTIDEVDRKNIDEALNRMRGAIEDIQERYVPAKGRPKMNGDLEVVIKKLQIVFEDFSGQLARTRFAVSPYDAELPYKGPFMDFLKVVIWGHYENEKPSIGSLGEAARNAIGLRKS